jgi:hypothetical protein
LGVRVFAGLTVRVDVAWPLNQDPRDEPGVGRGVKNFMTIGFDF